jgi:hypothetical protein
LTTRKRELKSWRATCGAAAADDRAVEVERLVREQNAKLERIAGMTSEEAKRTLMANLEGTARAESARLIADIRRGRPQRRPQAKKIVLMAIQRSAADTPSNRPSRWCRCPTTK